MSHIDFCALPMTANFSTPREPPLPVAATAAIERKRPNGGVVPMALERYAMPVDCVRRLILFLCLGKRC